MNKGSADAAIRNEAERLAKQAAQPQWLRDEIKKFGAHAVYIGGTLAPSTHVLYPPGEMPHAIGGNMPFRSVMVGSTGSYADTITWRLDQIPYEWQGVLGRAWVQGEEKCAALEAATGDSLRRVCAPIRLRKRFVALVNWEEDFTAYILRIAADNLIEAWDDVGLIEHLIRVYRNRRKADHLRHIKGGF